MPVGCGPFHRHRCLRIDGCILKRNGYHHGHACLNCGSGLSPGTRGSCLKRLISLQCLCMDCCLNTSVCIGRPSKHIATLFIARVSYSLQQRRFQLPIHSSSISSHSALIKYSTAHHWDSESQGQSSLPWRSIDSTGRPQKSYTPE